MNSFIYCWPALTLISLVYPCHVGKPHPFVRSLVVLVFFPNSVPGEFEKICQLNAVNPLNTVHLVNVQTFLPGITSTYDQRAKPPQQVPLDAKEEQLFSQLLLDV